MIGKGRVRKFPIIGKMAWQISNHWKISLSITGQNQMMNFLAKDGHDDFSDMDIDYNPRTTKKSTEEITEHQKAFAQMLTGQIEELLTRYGKIDIIWFDGKATKGCGSNRFISLDRIRQLQPGIVIIPRMHKAGDFASFRTHHEKR